VYIYFSSGIVRNSQTIKQIARVPDLINSPNLIDSGDLYTTSKIHAEAKHRAQSGSNIIDLRLFSFFSRFIDLSASFLVVEMLRAILEKKEFVTNRKDIIRDFVHPHDLSDLVIRCTKLHGANLALDVYSKAPVRKKDLIEYLMDHYDMRVSYDEIEQYPSPTGQKDSYYSENRSAEYVAGYMPAYSSLDTIRDEVDFLIGKDKKNNHQFRPLET
jgi:nucleoside-diphosphate-sugar epimerase